jgi:hypothetical protein
MIQIYRRDGLFLLFDNIRNATYRIASTSQHDAKATILRASLASEADWLDSETLDRALKCVARQRQPERGTSATATPTQSQAMEL